MTLLQMKMKERGYARARLQEEVGCCEKTLQKYLNATIGKRSGIQYDIRNELEGVLGSSLKEQARDEINGIREKAQR